MFLSKFHIHYLVWLFSTWLFSMLMYIPTGMITFLHINGADSSSSILIIYDFILIHLHFIHYKSPLQRLFTFLFYSTLTTFNKWKYEMSFGDGSGLHSSICMIKGKIAKSPIIWHSPAFKHGILNINNILFRNAIILTVITSITIKINLLVLNFCIYIS